MLKDIGMSLVDKNTLKKKLSEREKKMIDKHGQFSKKNIIFDTIFFSLTIKNN